MEGVGDEPIFFQHRDGPILPSLKFVHRYPGVEFTRVTVDKGAIPYLLGGANVMCPGLTNPGELFHDRCVCDNHDDVFGDVLCDAFFVGTLPLLQHQLNTRR